MRRLKIFVILFSFFGILGFSQNEPGCGTTVSERHINFLNSKLKRNIRSAVATQSDTRQTEYFIAITAHIVRRSDGTGGLAEAQLTDAMEYLNESYAAMNMNFFLIGDINYIDADEFFDFDSSQESQITGLHNVNNTINVYFYNSLSSGNSALCGYAYFPATGRDHVMMANSCTVNRGSTFPHEIGHYFNLYHTHGKTNTGTTDELVDGTNCVDAGDDICDTPADPNLSGKVDGSTCSYTGDNRDSNGEVFSPNPRNFMSYAPGQCRELFSVGQGDRMVAAYENFKTYLIDKYYVADFSAVGRRICEGETISFEDESIAASILSWEFEGGTPATSDAAQPIITYAAAGVYDVTLSIETEAGDTETKVLQDYITVLDNSNGIASTAGSFEEVSLEEELINEDLGITFVQTDVASTDGTKSVLMNFKDYSTVGAEDFLVTDKLLTTSNKSFQISFDYAYARYDAEFFDGLAVVIKKDCGEWNTIWEKSGSDLATAPDATSTFVPTVDQWSNVSILIQVPSDFDNTEVAFKTTNGFGNNLYIDNYQITPVTPSFSISNVNVTNATCSSDSDGSISVTADGAGSYEFSINDNFQTSGSFTDLAPGDYIVAVKDAGTDETLNTFVSVGPDPIVYELLNQTDPSCSSDATGRVDFSITGGTGNLEINFDDAGFGSEFSFENLTTGTYEFQIRDENGCTIDGSVRFRAENTNPSKPVISPFLTLLSIQVDPDVTAIQWYFNGEPIEGATGGTIANPASGEYTVEVSNEFCSSISDVYIVLAADEIKSNLVIAPNPVEDILTLQMPADLQESVELVQVLDLTGKVITESTYTSELNVSDLNAGIYVLSLSASDGVVTKRFIKR